MHHLADKSQPGECWVAATRQGHPSLTASHHFLLHTVSHIIFHHSTRPCSSTGGIKTGFTLKHISL